MKINQNVQWVILSVIILATGLYLSRNSQVLDTLNNLTTLYIFLLFALLLGSFLFLAYQFRILMYFFGIKLTVREWFGLTICNTMYSYLVPTVGGMWLRAFYLKKKHDFLYTHYASLVLGSFLLMYANACVLGILTVGLDNGFSGESHWLYLAIFPSLGLLPIAGWLLLRIMDKVSFRPNSEKLNKILNDFQHGMKAFREKPSLMWHYLVFNAGFIVFNGLSYAICLHGLGATDVTFLSSIGVMALTSYSKVISLTPGNLGIREMIMTLSCHYLGVSFDVALLAACVNRAASMIITFILGIIYSKILMNDVSKAETA